MHEDTPSTLEEMASTQSTGAHLPLLRLGIKWVCEELRVRAGHERETEEMPVNTLPSCCPSCELLVTSHGPTQ
jgi:hypothetical protein